MASVESIRNALRGIQDPELHFSIVDLGLVRTIAVTDQHIDIAMTLTSIACPVGEELRTQVETAALSVPGITSADVTISFDQPWSAQEATREIQQHFALLGIPLTR